MEHGHTRPDVTLADACKCINFCHARAPPLHCPHDVSSWRIINSAPCLLPAALLCVQAAVLTGKHWTATALNILFAYIFPFLFYWAALLTTQILGNMYRIK